MLFKPELAQKILLKSKTQTRRLVKPGEYLLVTVSGTKMVLGNMDRIKWRTGESYAIQPGRGKASLGRFKLLDIRKELARDISEADAIAEGVEKNCAGDWPNCPGCLGLGKCEAEGEYINYLNGTDEEPAYSAVESFLSLFESINGKAALDKEVWVLVFELEQSKPTQ